MSEVVKKHLKKQYNGTDLNNGVKIEVKGLKFLYVDGIIFNLGNDDSTKSDKIHIVENFIDYSVNKSLKQKQ